MLSAFVACLLFGAEALPPDVAVVAPREFVAAIQPWAEHRQKQGHRLVHVANDGSPAEIRAAIRKVAAGGALKYVLIVGDSNALTPALSQREREAMAARSVPAPLV